MSDLVPWSHFVAPGVLCTKDAKALQRVWKIHGLDIIGETMESQGARMMQANDIFKRLGGKWTLHAEAQRTRVSEYPQSVPGFPVAQLIDAERKRAILEDPGARETHYYMTLTWQPPTATVRAMQGLFVANTPEESYENEKALKTFLTEAEYFAGLLGGVLASCEPCTIDETLTYLHSTVSDRWHPLRWSGHALDIDTQLCDTPYHGGWYPQLGDWHLRTCSFVAYPAVSHVGMVRQLEALDMDFRWVTRWTGMEKVAQAGVLKKMQYAWTQQEKHFFARMGESLSGHEARVIDSDARNKAQETDAARQELGADLVAIGNFTSTITVWDEDQRTADEKLQGVRQAFEAQGFTLQMERIHSREAWRSSHPGNRQSSVRKDKQSTLFLAHLFPGLQASWGGPERDEYMDGPPWFLSHTDTSSLFRVVQHVRDVGHTMVLGPTGAGKSVLVALMVAQWFARYRHVQCFWFDVDRSARLLTLLLGGQWYELGAPGIAFQPLRHIDDPAQRGVALQWLLDRIEDAGYQATGMVQTYLSSALQKVRPLPVRQRTLSALLAAMVQQTNTVDINASAGRRGADGTAQPDTRLQAIVMEHYNAQMALLPFTTQGEYGWLFDADHDDLAEGPLHTFEQRQLLTVRRLIKPVTSYVFQQIEQRFSTETPTWLPMDEAAITAALPAYAEKYDEWLMTTRKKGVALGFLINALHQVAGSALGLMLQDNCPTRYFLPNPDASSEQMAKVYQSFGLTDQEVRQIALAQPTRDIYYSCVERGKRMFHIPLSRFVLDCLARNTAEDHGLMDDILKKEGREGFAEAWLTHHGYPRETRP